MTYQPVYRSRYKKRRRRRNSHYGVLLILIFLLVLIIFVGIRMVKSVGNLVLGKDQMQIVYQLDNTSACVDGNVVDLGGAAPFKDTNGNLLVSADSLRDQLQLDMQWEQVSQTETISYKDDIMHLQVGSKTLRLNDDTSSMAAAPLVKDGMMYIPIRDFCQALGWKVYELDEQDGNLIVVSKSKKELSNKKLDQFAEQATKALGPSHDRVLNSSVLLRVSSDKLLNNGSAVKMAEQGKHTGQAVILQDEKIYVPLKAAMAAVGGSAAFDGEKNWQITFNEVSSSIEIDGKIKVDGEKLKGDSISTYQDAESGCFYVSAPLFAALLGKTYTDLGGDPHAFACTDMSLEEYASQKEYLNTCITELTEATGGNVPDADVYIALTFDDGPTGSIDGYAEGLTAHLLDGLKERGAVATFFMVGERIEGYDGTMQRLKNEGHELGNHTMTHPSAKLSGLDAESVYQQVDSTCKLIEEKSGKRPTVMRPVGGGVNETVKEQMKKIGLPIVNWSVDTEDWHYRDAERVKDVIVEQAGDGDIVLMHDLYPTTVEGVLAAIDVLQSQTDKTYAFVTVSQLAAVKGITLEPGVVYNGLSDTVAREIADGTYSPAEFV